MKIKLLLFFIITIFAIPVLAQVTADITEGCMPLKVSFQGPSSNTYFWDFKDGVTSDKQDPVNVFNRPGTFNVTLYETVGGPVIGSVKIIVYPDPVLNIKVASGCAPLNAQFESVSQIDPAISINNYIWVFGDGKSSQASVSTASHLYSGLGKYDVSFSIETKFPTCNRTVIFNEALEVLQGPSASFSTTPASTISCRDTLDVTFVNKSTGIKPLTYAWNLGNGNVSAAENPSSQRYFRGQHTAVLNVSYPSNFVGCTSTYAQTVSVGKPQAIIVLDKNVACINSFAKVSTPTAGVYTWNFGPNASPATSSLMKDSTVFNKGGNQTISLTVTSPDGVCSDTKTAKIFIDEVKAEIQSPDPTFGCESPRTVNYKGVSNQSNVTYDWTFSDTPKKYSTSNVTRNYISASDNIYYDKNVLETFTASLEITSKTTGCKATASRLDTMWLPNARFMPNITKGCVPLTVNFSDSSSSFDKIVKWQWIYADGNKDTRTNKNTISHTFTTPGEYLAQLEVTTQKGCRDTSYAVLIEVGKKLSSLIDFTVDKNEVCPGEPVKLQANVDPAAATLIDAYHFQSEDNRVFHCSSQDNVSWSYKDKAGPQAVTLTVDYNGCFTPLTKPGLINVKGAIAKIDYYALCSAPLSYTFNSKSQNASKLAWTFGDGQTGNASKETHNYAASGDYNVVLTAEDPASGCAPTTDRATIKVRQVKAAMKIDTLLCINKEYTFSATGSKDVDATCHTGYTWQFPTMDHRPHTSAFSSAAFTFLEKGDHTVRLITQDVNGCKDTASHHFKIYDMVVRPTANKSLICNPATVQFTDKSTADTTITSWDWYFEGNNVNQQNPSYTFTTPPSGNDLPAYYYVTLIVKDKLGCTEEERLPIQHYAPTANISVYPKSQFCLGDSVSLTANFNSPASSGFTFSMNLGNGTTSSLKDNKILYKTAKDYNVSLSFTENISGCSGTADALIQVQDYPKAAISTNVDTLKVLCAPQNVFFKDASQSSFPPLTQYWDFGDGQTSWDTNYSLFYDKGIWKAKHIVQTSFGCADTVSQTFKVFKPEGKFELSKNTICKGEEIEFSIKDTADVSSYTWAFGDGNTIDNTAPVTHRYNFHPPSGQTYAKLVIRGFDGICPIALQSPVYVKEVIAEFDREDGTDTSICFSEGAYHFTNASMNYDSFTWDFGDGKTSQEVNPAHQYAVPGTYDVTLSVASTQFSCKDTIIKKAVIYPNPAVIARGDTVCLGNKLHPQVMNPVATSKYLWTPSTGLSYDTVPAPEATLAHSVYYKVTETDTNGCTGFADLAAIVIEPSSLADWDTSIVVGDQIALPVYGPPVYKFTWTPEDGLSCLQCNYPEVRPLKDITYLLKVQDIRGCFPPETYKFFVEVKPETFVKLPSTFTPNGDGANDVIYVRGWGIKDLLEFKIFNRWGQLIYSSNDIREGWDGTFQGVVQNSDVYVYKVKVRTWRDEEISDEGYINLTQ